MISALHLIWILPLAAMLGFFIATLLAANGQNKRIITQQEEKESVLKQVLAQSMHYRYDEESCQSVLDMEQTVKNILKSCVEISIKEE